MLSAVCAPDDDIRITLEEAVRDFLVDEEARQLAKTTTCQSRTLLQQQLLPWAQSQSIVFLDQITTPKLREFRSSWKNSALTSQRKHHRLNSFFDFCIENEWVIRNPAKRMKAVHVSPIPTDYFTPAEFAKIIDGTYTYGEWRGGRDFEYRALRLRGLILLMRWSGLSILDAVTLERNRLQGHRLLLYRHKTKVPVFVPIPAVVAEMMHALPNSNPRYFFGTAMGIHTRQRKDGNDRSAGFQNGEPEDRRWPVQALPSPHVPRYICSRAAPGRSTP